MLTWVIVKARIDGSLNLNEHCVACDDENGASPAGPTLRDPLLCVIYVSFSVATLTTVVSVSVRAR